MPLFAAAQRALGPLPLVAEDLGVITPPVDRLREELGIPGMHILQWAFGARKGHPNALANHREYAVVYTGTHDNDTAAGWWASAKRSIRVVVEEERVRAGIAPAEPAWVLVELALASRPRLSMIPLQDVLGLGSEARMNLPATIGRNWRWQLEPGELTRDHARRLREATARWGRLPS
jgi:4-alpha-glucanotransferase